MRTPLTPEEHERIRSLLAYGPLPRCPGDSRLIYLGLAEKHGGSMAVTAPCMEQIGPNGREPYYERDRRPNPVSYPTIGEEDVLSPGFFFAKVGDRVRVVSMPEE